MKLTKAIPHHLGEIVGRLASRGEHLNDFGASVCRYSRYPFFSVIREDVLALKRRGLIEMRRPGNWDLTPKGKAVGEYFSGRSGA